MKKLLTILAAAAIAVGSLGQKATTKSQPAPKEEKYDIILKMDGDELEGNVKEILETDVKFSYKGETLVYTLKKADIIKIKFASGRIEFFNKPPDPNAKKTVNPADATLPQNENNRMGDHHNKVAILPFHYTIDKQRAAEEVSDEVQEECFNILSKHSEGLSILSPHTTNAVLAKAGVNFNTMANYTMDELCNILGVEFLVEGRVTQNRTALISSLSNTYNNNYSNRRGIFSNTNYSASTQTQSYKTVLHMAVYDDKNSTLYTEEKQSLWSTDTYKSTLIYLLKRCPLYKK